MTFREIEFGSDDFRKECDLRNEVLRVPIGLCLCDEDLDQEKQQFHFGLFDECGDVLACVIAAPRSSTEAQVRQMAVHPGHQGKGFGRMILHCAEAHLARQGFDRVFMHARMTAVGFYEKLGYVTTGNEFTEVGIPHLRMWKRLSILSSRSSPDSARHRKARR